MHKRAPKPDQSVAKTILEQLGGGRFTVMTGAKNYLSSPNSLSFQLPRTRDFVKDGIQSVRITLTPADAYDIEFWSITKNVRIKRVDGIYAEQLQAVFTEATGLDTHL